MSKRSVQILVLVLLALTALGTWNNLQGDPHEALREALGDLGHPPERFTLMSLEYGPRLLSRYARARFVAREPGDVQSVELEITRALPFAPWTTRSLKAE